MGMHEGATVVTRSRKRCLRVVITKRVRFPSSPRIEYDNDKTMHLRIKIICTGESQAIIVRQRRSQAKVPLHTVHKLTGSREIAAFTGVWRNW